MPPSRLSLFWTNKYKPDDAAQIFASFPVTQVHSYIYFPPPHICTAFREVGVYRNFGTVTEFQSICKMGTVFLRLSSS